MSSSESKRALVCLLVAVVFLAVVGWWKYDQIFGGSAKGTGPGGSSGGPGGTGELQVAGPAGLNPPFERVANPEAEATTISVRVLDQATGAPLPGARVVVFSRLGTVLADELSGDDGTAVTRLTKPVPHAVAAWHRDHQIGAVLASSGPVELRLEPLTFLTVTLTPDGAAQKAWSKTCRAGVILRNVRTFNPAAAGPDFISFKLYEHLGIREHLWVATENPVQVPKYIPQTAKISFHSEQRLADHFDRSGLRNAKPPADLSSQPLESTAIDVDGDTTAITLEIEPSSPHALVAQYQRRAGETSLIMLQMSQLERHHASPYYGDMVSVTTKYTTFDDQAGKATFQVFDLNDTPVYPTLIFYPEKGERKLMRCNPIEIDGLTTADLTPLQYAKLTVSIQGDSDPASTSAVLLDDDLEPITHLDTRNVEGKKFEWTRLEPITYRLIARDSKRAIEYRELKIRPGEHRVIEAKMHPGCGLTMIFPGAKIPDEFSLTNGNGVELRFPRNLWSRHFNLQPRENNELILSGLRDELYLAQGTYEYRPITRDGTRGPVQKLVLDSAFKTLRIE